MHGDSQDSAPQENIAQAAGTHTPQQAGGSWGRFWQLAETYGETLE